MTTEPPRDADAAIDGYHAHVYYDPAATRGRAERVRASIAERFPEAQLGRWHDAPVGPHPRAMFQIAFAVELFPRLVPWLMLNRLGLAVLVHPETGDARADHLVHAVWMGEVLPLNADVLPAGPAKGAS
jgi:DOPA 4,5-dioxygenase